VHAGARAWSRTDAWRLSPRPCRRRWSLELRAPRRHRPVSAAADERGGAEGGRENADPGPEPHPALAAAAAGLPARQTHDYRRNGLTSVYATLAVASGKGVGECRARHTGADFLAFLRRLARTYRQRELHVILDNSSTHSTPAVQAWLAQHPRVQFHFTPTGAPWLKMVEAWFSILTRKSVRRGSFDTVRALIRQIERYLVEWNAHPPPFIWTKELADIIRKVLRRRHAR
jgi:transposase